MHLSSLPTHPSPRSCTWQAASDPWPGASWNKVCLCLGIAVVLGMVAGESSGLFHHLGIGASPETGVGQPLQDAVQLVAHPELEPTHSWSKQGLKRMVQHH